MKKKLSKKEITEISSRYPRFIRWSAKDECFVGSLPDLDGDCAHGDTPEKVAEELKICAELAIEARLKFIYQYLSLAHLFSPPPAIVRKVLRGTSKHCGIVWACRNPHSLKYLEYRKIPSAHGNKDTANPTEPLPACCKSRRSTPKPC